MYVYVCRCTYMFSLLVCACACMSLRLPCVLDLPMQPSKNPQRCLHSASARWLECLARPTFSLQRLDLLAWFYVSTSRVFRLSCLSAQSLGVLGYLTPFKWFRPSSSVCVLQRVLVRCLNAVVNRCFPCF